MAYLLDANVFIAAKNLHYGLDFCPAFWDWLIRENKSGKVFSIEKVGDEIAAIEDELSHWADAVRDGFFLPPAETTLRSFAAVTTWVQGQDYAPAAISTFFQTADYYLVAQAHDGKHTVVTHEVPSKSINKVKIPNVCVGMKIKCMSPYEMLRRERARFVLGKQPTAVAGRRQFGIEL
ncbi:MAG TPA: DUF4411 family protein [Phycisphaerae bacterium]|nr:DUF4411 family protein [Phycisphaerae bacterium]HOM51105.1 DUF4411 family protein [Phycisphaerae bacterium]HON67514.1 DUF4411 family protein [Phycisphaerae bacterium]HOQ86083.1 DUF4411 family protein [Phycisphaerae bacterium]HPP25233.1 DUF4411 family protein [Phycisphaerae bacterium]